MPSGPSSGGISVKTPKLSHIQDKTTRKLVQRACKEGGYYLERRKSGHFVLTKPGLERPLVIAFSPRNWGDVHNTLKSWFRKESWWTEQ